MITVFHGPDPYAAGHSVSRAALPISGEGFFYPEPPHPSPSVCGGAS